MVQKEYSQLIKSREVYSLILCELYNFALKFNLSVNMEPLNRIKVVLVVDKRDLLTASNNQ